MASVEWTPLPTLWPQPAVSAVTGALELLIFTQNGVLTWEVRHNPRIDPTQNDDLLASGTADTFEAAKAAALHEASLISRNIQSR